MSKFTENRLMQAMNKPEARKAARRVTLRTVLVCALALLMLCAIALAAANWGSREFLTFRDEEGAHVNEELAGYIQPVGRTFTGAALTVDVIDAIYDGESVVLAWTARNTSDRNVYLLLESMTVDGNPMGQGSMENADEIVVEPGQTATGGLSSVVKRENGGAIADTCRVGMKYSVLALNGEVVRIGGLNADADEAGAQAYHDEIDRLIAEGNVVMAPDGWIELPSGFRYDAEGTRTETLVAAGLAEPVEELDIEFTLTKNSSASSAVKDGETISFDVADYTLRVVKADLSPNVVSIELERVFPNRETAERYAKYYSGRNAHWWYGFLNEEGEDNWYHNGGGTAPDRPEERADGTWVWTYSATMTGIQKTPRSVTIVPERTDYDAGETDARVWEEAVTITFE